MKEDDDGLATVESTMSIDKIDSTYNGKFIYDVITNVSNVSFFFVSNSVTLITDISRENSMLLSDPDESYDKNSKKEISKAHSGYGIANGSVVKQENEGQNVSSMPSGEKGIPRSETIGAIGHRPYTAELVPPSLRSEKPIKDKEEIDNDGGDGGDDDDVGDEDGRLCQKYGHSSKRQ